MRMTMLEWALAYALNGIPVFPLQPRSKAPLKTGGLHLATTDERQIADWWKERPDANLGIPMGKKSGLIGIDVDFKDGCRKDFLTSLPPTVVTKTPTGGRHVFFKYPNRGIKNNLKLETGATVRSDGYYFAVPGSIHPETNTAYEFLGKGLHEVSPEECPEWILKLNEDANKKQEPYAIPNEIGVGGRDVNLFRFASSLRAKGMEAAEILAGLRIANQRCNPPLPESDLVRITESVCKYNAGKKSRESKPQKWTTVGEDMLTERDRRIESYRNAVSFGISYLDRAFKGILDTDVVLCGARTGAGKTELVSTVAANAIEQGKRVGMFALEAEEKEISRRIKYRHIAREYFKKYSHTGRHLNFVDWEAGEFDDILLSAENEITKHLASKFSSMCVMYKTDLFTTEDLRRAMIEIKDKVDLLLLDHANMVDLDSESENRAMTELVMTIRQTALVIQKPVLVVAHVRKSDPKNRPILPDIEDFHGTSNLAKVCTKAFMIGPAMDEESLPTKYPTYMRACKFRKDGSRTRYTALINFDITTNSYEDNFIIGELKSGDTIFKPITEQAKIPYWAKVNAIESRKDKVKDAYWNL